MSEQITVNEKKITKSDLMGVFIRSNLFQGSWNFERMQSLGFCFSVIPVINVFILKKDLKENKLSNVTLSSLIRIHIWPLLS